MKIRAVIFCIAGALAGGCASPTGLPLSLPAKHAIVNRQFGLTQPEIYWTPAEADIAILEEELSRLWVRPDRRVKGRPWNLLSEYIVRYYGETKGGHRVVWGEGQLRGDGAEADFLGEGSTPRIMMTAFGAAKFRVQFDPNSRRVIKLEIFVASL